jgi:hypothetical protein
MSSSSPSILALLIQSHLRCPVRTHNALSRPWDSRLQPQALAQAAELPNSGCDTLNGSAFNGSETAQTAAHYQAAPRGGSEQRICLLSVFAALRLRVIKLQVKATRSPTKRLQLTGPTSWGRFETLNPASLRFRFLRTTGRMIGSHRHLSGLALDRPTGSGTVGVLRFKQPPYRDATKASRCTRSQNMAQSSPPRSQVAPLRLPHHP